jgi:hypothetical protein
LYENKPQVYTKLWAAGSFFLISFFDPQRDQYWKETHNSHPSVYIESFYVCLTALPSAFATGAKCSVIRLLSLRNFIKWNRFEFSLQKKIIYIKSGHRENVLFYCDALN